MHDGGMLSLPFTMGRARGPSWPTSALGASEGPQRARPRLPQDPARALSARRGANGTGWPAGRPALGTADCPDGLVDRLIKLQIRSGSQAQDMIHIGARTEAHTGAHAGASAPTATRTRLPVRLAIEHRLVGLCDDWRAIRARAGQFGPTYCVCAGSMSVGPRAATLH